MPMTAPKSTNLVTFYKGGTLVAQFKFRYINDTKTEQLIKDKMNILKEQGFLKKDLLYYIDELEERKPSALKQAA